MKHEIVDGIPMITEYTITVLVKDLPHSETFYSKSAVKSVIDKLEKLSKKYILTASVHPVH